MLSDFVESILFITEYNRPSVIYKILSTQINLFKVSIMLAATFHVLERNAGLGSVYYGNHEIEEIIDASAYSQQMFWAPSYTTPHLIRMQAKVEFPSC